MNNLEVQSSVHEIQEWVQRVKRGLAVERKQQGADPRILDMLIENLETELHRLSQLVHEE